MKWRIMVSAPYMIPHIGRFDEWFTAHNMEYVIPDVKERLEEEDLLKIIEDFDGVVCGDDRFTEEVYKKAKKLKVVSKWGTGIDSINKDIAEKYGVLVCNTPDAFSHPVSDTAMAYILAFSRDIMKSDKMMKQGGWEKFVGRSLSEQTIGIIGCGNIGTRMARKAAAFGMRILVYDIRKIPLFIKEQYGIEQVDLGTLLEEADYVTLHCDLNSTSKYIINETSLKMMKKTAYLINTARGGLVDESALIAALQNGGISGCGLDVYEFEPLALQSPLRRMENVLLSAHNSNSSPYYWDKVHISTLDNLYNGLIKQGGKG